MNTLLTDIIDTLEDITTSVHGVPQGDWVSNHIFYNESRPIGTGAMNRGRCPFVRVYRNDKNYDIQSIQDAGGSVDSSFVLEIVVSTVNQEPAWDLAFGIFEEFMKDLKNKNNYLDTSFTTDKLQINPMMYMLRVVTQVRNSFGG